MKMRTLVLGSAAGISLVGALAFASPSFAQYDGNPPQVSTPAERQQTQQLNGQAADGTTATPSQLNGQAPRDGNAQTGTAAQAQYDAQNAQYQQQQQDYLDKRQQYDRDRAKYGEEHARYEHDLHRYDVRADVWTDYPRRTFSYRYGDRDGLQRLYLIQSPQEQLWNTAVEDPSGEWVGKVRNIDTGIDGRPFRIEVALNRRVSVWVPAGDFRFDPVDHVLFTDLNRSQLWDMPGATVESNAYYAP